MRTQEFRNVACMTEVAVLHALQVYVVGLPVIDLLATIREPGMAERPEGCEAFEGALLRLIQQPGLGEPIQETTAPPRPAGPPHAGTCSLPKVFLFTRNLRAQREIALKCASLLSSSAMQVIKVSMRHISRALVRSRG